MYNQIAQVMAPFNILGATGGKGLYQPAVDPKSGKSDLTPGFGLPQINMDPSVSRPYSWYNVSMLMIVHEFRRVRESLLIL